jgi:hypothetical protein
LRTSIAIIAALASATVSAGPAFAAERNIPVSDFSKLMLSGSTDVTVRTGSSASVVAIGADADIDRMDVRVSGDTLVVDTKRGSWRWTTREGVKLRVTVPMLSSAVISGSGDVDIDRINGPFSGRISGSGDLAVASIDSPTLALSVSGSGDIDMGSGRCGSAKYSTTGSGDIEAASVRCESLTAVVTGSGSIGGQASGTADLRVTGSGDIDVTGGARCTTKTTGSGTTRCR